MVGFVVPEIAIPLPGDTETTPVLVMTMSDAVEDTPIPVPLAMPLTLNEGPVEFEMIDCVDDARPTDER